MKHIILTFSLMFAVVIAKAATEINGIYYNLNDADKTAEVADNPNLYRGAISIPSTVKYNGTTYNVTSIGSDAFRSCSGLTSVDIPNSVTTIEDNVFYRCKGLTSLSIPSSIETIGYGAFSYCTNLTNINIPSSVTTIGENAFDGCSSLPVENNLRYADTYLVEAVDKSLSTYTVKSGTKYIGSSAFEDCSNLTSISIPNSVKNIGANAFKNCASLTTCTIPNSVTTIGHYAFSSCTNLKSVSMADSVEDIGMRAFLNCTKLTQIGLSKGLQSIKSGLFENCNNLYELIIPDGVKVVECLGLFKVGGGVSYLPPFSGCTSLSKLLIPASVSSINEYSFSGAKIKNLYFWGVLDDYVCFSHLDEDTKVYAKQSEVDKIKVYFKNVFPLSNVIETPKLHITDYDKYLTALRIALEDNPLFEYESVDVSCGDITRSISISPGTTEVIIEDLYPDKYCYVYVNYRFIGDDETKSVNIFTPTKKPDLTINKSCTQTTITINSINASSDQYSKITEKGFYYPYYYGYNDDEKKKAEGTKISGLCPNKEYEVTPYVVYNGTIEYRFPTTKITTESMYPRMNLVKKTPTTLELSGYYSRGDAEVTGTYINIRETSGNYSIIDSFEGNHVKLTGLNPGMQFYFQFGATCETGSESASSRSWFYVKMDIPISFVSLVPKVTNKGQAIVAAETNIDDDETNTGFEWRKVDAPEVVPSKRGEAVIYDGKIEGLVKNLDVNSYYMVRPYYKPTSGYEYFGEWIGFDPSDFSYFEPTVHTYGYVEVVDGVATFVGYAMQGSDDIISQGFEYWKDGTAHSNGFYAPSSGVKTVTATGQRMTAQVDGLAGNTTYGYRAFVKTEKGITYGEECYFTTPVSDDIETIEVVRQQTVREGVYTLSGVKVANSLGESKQLPSGIYIVNGKKMVVR